MTVAAVYTPPGREGLAALLSAVREAALSGTNLLVRGMAVEDRTAHEVIDEPKTERSRRDVPLSPATVALLRSVKVSQAVERLSGLDLDRDGPRLHHACRDGGRP